MKEVSCSTSGSSKKACDKASCRDAMAPKDVDCVAWVSTWMAPVSCSGKKPLSLTTYKTAVSARVPKNTPQVRRV